MKQITKLLNDIAANKKNHFWLFFCVLLFLSLFMIYSYYPLHPGHDFFFHYRRLQALMDGLSNSPFLIYLDYNAVDGYGYFTKAFYPDVMLIPFAIIGNYIGIECAYLLMLFTYTMLCGIFTYKMVDIIFKNAYAAAIGAILYTFCFYRLLDLYNRAAIGEAISFTFVPIVFLGLYHIIKGDYKKWYILAVGFSLMIFTHLISTVLMFITVIIFLISYNRSIQKEPQRIWYLILSGLATLVITAYYLYPMIEQMLSNDFYYHSRQIMSKAQDAAYEMFWIICGMFTGIVHPKQVFIPGIGLFLTGAIALRLFVYGKSSQLKAIDISVIVGLIYIFACSAFFPWSVFPFNLLNFIQLPWRLYEFSSFFFAIAGGFYLSLLVKSNWRAFLALALVVFGTCLMLSSDGQFYSEIRSGRQITQVAEYSNDYHLGGMEYFPNKVPSIEFISERGNKVITSNPDTEVTRLEKSRGTTSFNLKTNGNKETVELPLVYYKGYTAILDNEEITVSESANGLVEISANNSGFVKVYYGGTAIQKISWFISLISIIGLCIYIFAYTRKKKIEAR